MYLSAEEKQALVSRYHAGESVAEICADTGVARSTFYTWIRPYTTTITDSGHVVSQQEFIKMKQRIRKLEQKVEILQKVSCTASAPLQEKLQELSKLYGQYSVHALCEALCVSRGTFYNHIFRRKEVTAYDKRKSEMRKHIKAVFDESHQRFGANKIAAVLSTQGISTSSKYVRELMQEMGLQSITRYSKRDYQKGKRLAKKQNVLQRQFKADEPNRVWVSDVTCFKINDKYLYICVILDLFSRKVVAYRVSPKNSTYLITSTFRQAYQNRNAPQSLMFHSDQGAQYTSKTFCKLLRMNKVVQSFSAPGQPHDNAVMESFFSFMKREEIYRTHYKSEQQFAKSVDNYIEFYNTQRPHSTLNYKTPDQFEAIYEVKKKYVD
ncbi:MAG: IS3 family transposase [Oscillibacter sp.]|jgi:Transposase and inactivated derivatives|nr:IS3 family transposase [Oscillibacter sp.]MCI9634549.1 IS3 family transposase [Ruminococcus sp.]